MAQILIIDDEPSICAVLSRMVERQGDLAYSSGSIKQGLRIAREHAFDVVFLDVRLPDGSGLDIISALRNTASNPEVIVMTGMGDPNGAELAIKNGAWGYIEKPATPSTMRLPLMRALEFRRQRRKGLPEQLVLDRQAIVGNSRPIVKCLQEVARAAVSGANVLITGETGTGKELFAEGVHKNSSRAAQPFVVVDCAALPESLVESLMFGHVKGSFTGAGARHKGFVEQAHGGTLFMDEVGELIPNLQKAFLRVIQERRFRPVGSERERDSDFRVIAATNRDLDEMVAEGAFRQDLLYRLRSFEIHLPPLREYSEDIASLVHHYIIRICRQYGKGLKGYSPEILETLMAHDWPGNVRELVNVIEQTIAAAGDEPVLYSVHLPTFLRVGFARARLAGNPSGPAGGGRLCAPPTGEPGSLRQYRQHAVERAEKSYLEDLMAATGWDIKEACRRAGLSRGRLYALMKKYGVSRQG